MFRLTNYWALLLLTALAPTFYYSWKSLNVLSSWRRYLALGLRGTILLLLILALSGLHAWRPVERLALFYVLDISASVDEKQVRELLPFIKSVSGQADPSHRTGLIVFGREASVEIPLMPASKFKSFDLENIRSAPGRDYTDIAAALRLAAANFPSDSDGRILLLSDGGENLGSALEEAKILAGHRIEIYTKAIEKTFRPDVLVESLRLPADLKIGEPFHITIPIQSNYPTEARLKIFRNDTFLGEKNVRLEKDKRNVFVIPQTLERAGFYSFRVEVEADGDARPENNVQQGFAFVAGKPKLLYCSDTAKSAGTLLSYLPKAHYEIHAVDADHFPETLAALQDYDLVIFDNISALRISENQMKLIQSYVRDLGGGFLMIGGENSFGPGGYYKTPVEEVLPVALDVTRKKHFPDLALMLVLDKSGSMGGFHGADKMSLAKEAAIQTVQLLSERDKVGVLAFDEAAKEVIRLTSLQNKTEVITAIGTIQAGGGTSMYPALAMAYDALRSVDAQLKHIIVLSDGISLPGDFYGIVERMAKEKITLSAVAVGNDADFRFMQSLAQLGGGRFYATDDIQSLPKIFTKETFLAARATILEEPFQAKPTEDSPVTRAIDWRTAPPLLGYVGTTHKPLAGTPLVSHHGDPVLAHWQYGLGRSLAFTSDARARWAARWLAWSHFGQLWNQAVRWTARQNASEALIPQVEVHGEQARLVVDAVSTGGAYRNNLSIAARVVGPRLQVRSLEFRQTAAGRYEAVFDIKDPGAYLINLTESTPGGSGTYSKVTGLVNAYSPEFKNPEVNSDLLRKLAETTGGKWQWQPRDLFEHTQGQNRTPRDLWPTLLWAAILLLPLDVAVRRVYFSQEQWVTAYHKWAARRKEPITGETASDIQPLKKVKIKTADEEAGTLREPFIVTTQPTPPTEKQSTTESEATSAEYTKRLLDVKRKLKR